jgi:3-dehydroquinate synthase
MKTVSVDLGERSYPIYIGSGLLQNLGDYLKEHALLSEIYLVTDDNVAPLYASHVLDALKNLGIEAPVFKVTAGEASKSLRVADRLYSELISHQATRGATIIALGGGVIGDLAGFVAATFMRGVKLVQIPTTILAQVDSSVGGKVGINHRLGKNLIGAFHQPVFVLIAADVLLTLPKREIYAGLAEVIKYGFIQDVHLFETLQSHLEELADLKDGHLTESVLETCCRIKAEVVRQDERESGLRAILNFGHTIGHALEAITGYETFLHGEAILHGMRGAIRLSQIAGHLSKNKAASALALIHRCLPPAIPEFVDADSLLKAMKHDKKRSSSGQLWVLLDDIGQAVLTREVSAQQITQAVEFVLSQ